jgi:hypothetical protein
MLPQAIACDLDLDDAGMVQKAIEQGSGDDAIAEDLSTFGEAAIGCQE